MGRKPIHPIHTGTHKRKHRQTLHAASMTRPKQVQSMKEPVAMARMQTSTVHKRQK